MTPTFEVMPLTAPPDATVVVPGSRSITNRALVCAALAEGHSSLTGVLAAEDTEAMLDCLRSLGIVARAKNFQGLEDLKAAIVLGVLAYAAGDDVAFRDGHVRIGPRRLRDRRR